MSEISGVMALLKTTLAAAYPARTVTRDLLDFSDRPEAELKAGVYALLAGPEDGFPNYRGRESNFGTLRPVIVGQIQVEESAAPSALEDAESDMIDEIKAFTRTVLPSGIDSLLLERYRRSEQLEHPYGWVTFQMEMMLS